MTLNLNPILVKCDWYQKWGLSGDIRPYVYVREDNKIKSGGSLHNLDWFPMSPVYLDPLSLDTQAFAEQIYFLETKAFGPSNMAMPRWVFYDCAVIPGFVAGFAMRTKSLPEALKKVLKYDPNFEWTPLSLFIIIPTVAKGQWVAHNLCAVNSLLPENERLYGLGFLTKAFGLWYANVEQCIGMTQWTSPALKLHSHYGDLEILTAYTPIHSFAKTVTYRCQVNTSAWKEFFTRDPDVDFVEKYEEAGFYIDPSNEQSMIELHQKIQRGEGPFFLSASDIAEKSLTDLKIVFKKRKKEL